MVSLSLDYILASEADYVQRSLAWLCPFWGQCEITDNCSQDEECPNYPNDFCGTNQSPGVCVPVL
jgi:hypothetical protein